MSHTFKVDEGDGTPVVRFHYDQGLEGGFVTITLGYSTPVPGEPVEVTIPKYALIAFVAKLVRSEKIEELERATPHQVLWS